MVVVVVGIASNVLTNRLKPLTDEGVLDRVADPERPGRPKYILTDKGCDQTVRWSEFSAATWSCTRAGEDGSVPRMTAAATDHGSAICAKGAGT